MPRNTSTPPTLLLLLILLLFLTSATADPNDAVCVTQLHSSLSDPTNSLHNWTRSNLATPCGSAGFDSRLPGATCNNGRIFKLSLPNLSLSGPLTPFISNCSNLQTLDLSSNHLSGPIPTEFRLLLNLAVLNLSNNLLSSQIPPDLADCQFLNVLDLHSNLLSGPIPPQLGSLSRLSSFDVSDNRLQGLIPTSLSNRTATVPRFNASSFRGNKKLFGFPLRSYGDGRGLSVFAIVGIGVGSGIASLVVSFTVVCVWLRVSDRRLAFQEPKNSHHLPNY